MPTTAGQTYVDPVFGTTIRRLPDGFRHVYSQLQAFSDDDTLMLGLVVGQGYQVIRYPSMQVVPMAFNFAGTVAPRWLPNSHKIVTTDYNWSTGGAQLTNVTIRMWDCDAGTVQTLFTVPFVQCNSNVAEEQFSWDGQFMSLYAQDAAGVWHACIVNLHTGQVMANIPDSQFASLDWVGVSPLGTFMLTDSNGTSPPAGMTHGYGMETYNITTGAFIRQVYNRDDHLDHGLDAAGNEIALTTVLASQYNNNNPGIVTYNLATAVRKQLRQVTWTASPQHMSLQGPPGVGIIDSGWGAFDANGNQTPRYTGLDPFEGEIYAIYGDGSARRLAHHRCNPRLISDPTTAYFCQVQATCSKSGRLVAFCSNWNMSGQGPQGFVIENLVL